MLLAYLDEIGETGAFVSHDHSRFNTSPAFGYAGFVIPHEHARAVGAAFHRAKKTLFATELADVEDPGRWERKGSDVFQSQTAADYPQQLRVFNAFVRQIRGIGGSLFYYADEKPVGTPKQTKLDAQVRESRAMTETLNRLARHADRQSTDLLVMIDQINEKTRKERLARMYAHILGRAAEFPEMRRIIEPPMHIDSQLSANVQLADWVAACMSRAIDYQLLRTSKHRWVVETDLLNALRGSFTRESKLHLWKRSVGDVHNSQVLQATRVLFPQPIGQNVGASIDPDVARKMRGIAEASGH